MARGIVWRAFCPISGAGAKLKYTLTSLLLVCITPVERARVPAV